MLRVLFISNGHGETAIAARIARDVAALAPGTTGLDLFPAVGTGAGAAPLAVVGPRRSMPSGGLVAMGNVRAFARDLGAGFVTLFASQLAFLRATRTRYDVVVAVGDIYALGLAFVTGIPTFYVGTAKSVYVAPYGRCERMLLRRAIRVFVRDEPTAARLRDERVAAEAPGNAIVDLAAPLAQALPGTWIGILPGSREDAYAQAVRLTSVIRALGARQPHVGGLLSIAPTLDADGFARALAENGWSIVAGDSGEPFVALADGARVAAWSGDFGAFLASSRLVIGAAGTANEQAAARGVPVIVVDDRSAGGWYRMRQRRLLGDASLLVPAQAHAAAEAIAALLGDETRLHAMAQAGRARMGPPGGSAAIARAVVEFAA